MKKWRLHNPLTIGLGSILILAVLTLLLWSPWSQTSISGVSLRFYCAAGMRKPVRETIKQYSEEFGVEIQPSFSGSGALISDMMASNGKGDLYLSADTFHMREAQNAGLVAETIPVAIIRPVLVVNKRTQDELAAEGKPVTGLSDFLRKDLRVILADTKRAAVGRLVKEVLSRPEVDLWDAVEKGIKDSTRISTVGTVNRVAGNIRTNDRYIGVIWDALAEQHDDIVVVPVPEFQEVFEQVSIGIMVKSENPTAALQFARYLTAKDKGQINFKKEHFEPIADADTWAVAPEVHLSAGGMLKPGIEDLVKSFGKREGVRINTSFAGCGILISQMKSMKRNEQPGKFPDAYFSCDRSFLDDVQQWFGQPVTVSKNDIVLVVPTGNPKEIKTLHDLTRSDLKVGLAHPVNSALGKLVDLMLTRIGIHKQVYTPASKVTHTDAAHDLVNKMRVGALDAAVVYRSNVMSTQNNLEYMEIIDLNLEDALATQPYAISKETKHKYLMQRLLRAIVAQNSKNHFQTLGFHWVYQPPKE